MQTSRIWLITGDPGSGKTTVVSKVLLKVKTTGHTVGGVLTREVRSHGERQGFRLIDVSTEESGTLASAERNAGPRVGRYHVDLKTLSNLGVSALERASKKSDVLVCDEIGPMELFSPEFRREARKAILDSQKPVLCVVHKRLTDPLIDEIKRNTASKIYEVTFENRDQMADTVSSEILQVLRQGESKN